MDITFEWDESKRQVNLRKPGVDFADAVEVFYDDLACASTLNVRVGRISRPRYVVCFGKS
jgi:uncharacterized DUF497 family protein